MFFSVSKFKDVRFDVSYQKFDWWINLDYGWMYKDTEDGVVFAKGYCDQYSIQRLLNQTSISPNLTGNFCLLKITPSRGVELFNSEYRSFPLWAENQLLTNFLDKSSNAQPVWADQAVRLSNNNDVRIGSIKKKNKFTSGSTDLTTVIDNIVDLLVNRARQFKENCRTPVSFCRTGGIDTTLALALCNYTAIDLVHVDGKGGSSDFVIKNQEALKQYWGYKVLHNWNRASAIVTGSQGDEYFLRGPNAIAIVTAWHNIDFNALLDKNPNCYHYHHFNSLKNRTNFKNQYDNRQHLKEKYPSWEDLSNYILDILINDHQHWHAGETITWTPFKELNIANWCLSLPIDILLDNFLTGSIPKLCIERLDPTLLPTIDTFKNYNSLNNIHKTGS